MQLNSVLAEETTEEVRHRDHEPALVKVGERHHFPRLRIRRRLAVGGPPFGNLLQRTKTQRHKAPHRLCY
jgi:hypothetical protein